MITEKVINSLYKTYKNRPESPDELDVCLLFEKLLEHHDIEIDDNGYLVINSMPAGSPFQKIKLTRIHAIVEFENKIAIVLHSSIIFLSKTDSKSHIHIRQTKSSLLDKIFGKLEE